MSAMIRHLTASAVVIDPRTETVLLVWHRATGAWMFPGGHVDPGEAPIEAALREVFEETGVKAAPAGPGLQLPGMVWQPSPIVTAVIPAPVKPERPGKPAEAAHEHIDLLFVAVGDIRSPITLAEAEVSDSRWEAIDGLEGLPVRAEVPMLAQLAWEAIR